MDTSKPDDADFVETPGEVWVAETQLGRAPSASSELSCRTSRTSRRRSRRSSSRRQSSAISGAQGSARVLIGFIIVLALGMCLVQLAKKFPSAGGYFTYVSRTVGPRSGLLTGWMFALYSPIVAGPILAFLGLIFEGEFQSNYDWTWFHWWMLVIVGLPIITSIGYRGSRSRCARSWSSARSSF